MDADASSIVFCVFLESWIESFLIDPMEFLISPPEMNDLDR